MPVVGTKAAASAQGFGEFAKKATAAVYIEDVFSTWLYEGTGATQTITNGIDLAGKGGMTWFKLRAATQDHRLLDSNRALNLAIRSNSTSPQGSIGGSLTYNANGFTLPASIDVNVSSVDLGTAANYVSWTFRKQPKFFDVVTYTGSQGSGGTGQVINHNLGSTPGCIIVKPLSDTSGSGFSGLNNWIVYHRGLSSPTTQYLRLNTTNAVDGNSDKVRAVSDTSFTAGWEIGLNGIQYVAYVFAHNAGGFGLTGTDNVISCGITDGSKVTLGWEPQWILHKASNFSSNWDVLDTMRGMPWDQQARMLNPNLTNAEAASSDTVNGQPYSPKLYADGFELGTIVGNHIYIAIRRGPMKTPTSGTSVYSASLGAGNATETAGFPVDLLIDAYTVTPGTNKYVFDRLRGGGVLYTNTGDADSGGSTWTFDSNTTAKDLLRGSDTTIFWNFRRAPSFFDVVCYTGNGTTQNVSHNLSVAPELMLVKRRNTSGSWVSYNAASGAGKYIVLNSSNSEISDTAPWNNTTPTASVFTVSTGGGAFTATNASGSTYVAYLFASCPGVSKVGSYTGDGTTGRVINCGFTGGARFILIKRTDLSGPWYVWDSTRGIGAALDPYLALNNTDEQIQTSDSVDPNSSGFIVNQVGFTNINVSGGTYIYLAIA